MTDIIKSPVGIPCLGYESMAAGWGLIHDLLGGTQAMRDASITWLPMETRESDGSYASRLGRSILYNGLRDTLIKLSNKPFTHPVTITDLSAEIAYLEHDVDGHNKPLETFIREVLANLIKYGVAHIFVSHSKIKREDGKELTKADEARLGARVYLLNFSPKDLIGWQTEKTIDGLELVQIRTKEIAIEKDGKYGDVEVNYINVFNKNSYEIHKQDPDNNEKYELIEEGVSSFGRIPLITIYADRTGFMIADPPLMDLAWMNLAHWQSSSDQKNILRFTRFGLIFGKGLPEEMVKTGALDIGPSKAFLVESDKADMKYVEHNGKAIESGQKDLEDTEHKMRVLGNQPLMKKVRDTATAEKIDESRTVSLLQAWIGSLQRGMNEVLKLACEWRKVTPAETMGVNIYSDFEAAVLGGTDKELLLKMRQAKEITSKRFLTEEQRRGVLSLDMDVDDESEAVEAEAVDRDNLESLLLEDSPEEDLLEEDDE